MATAALISTISFVFLFFLGQLQRIELFFLPPFYLHDLLLLIFLGLIFLWKFSRVKKEFGNLWKKIKKRKIILFLLFWIILGWIVSFSIGSLSNKFIFYFIRFVTYGLFFYFVDKLKIIDKKYLRFSYFVVGFYLLMFGLFQYVFFPDMRFLSVFGWDDHYYRLLSTQFDPNFIGIIFVLLYFSFQRQRWIKKSFLKTTLSFFILLGVSLTFSRSTYLAFSIGLVIFAQYDLKKYLPGIILLILIILIPKPGGEGVNLARTASINARIETSQRSFSDLHSYQYLLGRGLFNNDKDSYQNDIYLRADHAYLEDNFLLLLFNATGIIGFVLSITLLGQTIRYLWKRDQYSHISLIVVLVHALFNNTIFQPFVFIYLLWGLIGKIDS